MFMKSMISWLNSLITACEVSIPTGNFLWNQWFPGSIHWLQPVKKRLLPGIFHEINDFLAQFTDYSLWSIDSYRDIYEKSLFPGLLHYLLCGCFNCLIYIINYITIWLTTIKLYHKIKFDIWIKKTLIETVIYQ